jgi:hypothetical protein
VPVKDVKAHATALGIAAQTLRRAREAIGVVSNQVEDVPHGGWLYELPDTCSSADPFMST